VAAGIAHDINNHLHLIVNHLALSDLEAAQRATERCSALTAGLLAYCRGNPVEVSPINVGDFLRDFTAQLRLPESIDLQLNIPDSLPDISANSLALTRVLHNLISNACDAMSSQGIIRIIASPHKIEICDSGPGIPAETADRIFHPFFTTKGAKGTGLGLWIVREMMRQQGGAITLWTKSSQTAPSHGACFVLRFRPYCPAT
jgi:signal transduction histidine kinase